jgi:hypothetical protein
MLRRIAVSLFVLSLLVLLLVPIRFGLQALSPRSSWDIRPLWILWLISMLLLPLTTTMLGWRSIRWAFGCHLLSVILFALTCVCIFTYFRLSGAALQTPLSSRLLYSLGFYYVSLPVVTILLGGPALVCTMVNIIREMIHYQKFKSMRRS